MKKKLVCIFISMLLFATVFSVAGNNKIDENINNVTTSDSWSMFQHDPAHSGFSPSTAPNTGTVVWIQDATSESASSPASPVVADGKIYVVISDSGPVHSLHCYNATTGVELWSNSTGSQIKSTPIVFNDNVYIHSSGLLYCYDGETGEQLWISYSAPTNVGSSPVIVNGRIYVAGYTFPNYYDNIFCLNASDRSIIWTFATTGFNGMVSSPAVVDDRVYVGSQDGKLHCLDAVGNGDGTTNELWNFPTGANLPSSPSVVDGRVYLAGSNMFYSLNASDGNIIWQHSIDSSISPSVAYGKVYIGSSSSDTLYCLDAVGNGDGTTDEVWNFSVGNFSGVYSPYLKNVAVADGKAYMASTGNNNAFGRVNCLDAETGDEIWNYETQGGISSKSIAIADGKLYVVSLNDDDTSHIYCFRDNEPPETPDQPDGPTEGYVGEEFAYTTNAVTDPDGDDIDKYGWDWDDGPIEWTNEPSASHDWDESGVYSVTVKARDIYGAESDLSDPLEVTITQPQLGIISITGGLLKVSAEILNIGDSDVNNIEWNISLEGGRIFVGQEASGTIDTLETGNTEIVVDKPIIGIGQVDITVTVSADGIEEITKTESAFVFLIFIIK